MKTKTIRILLLVMILALAGCNPSDSTETPDADMVRTDVALTIEARIQATTNFIASQTATPTNTSEPTATPEPSATASPTLPPASTATQAPPVVGAACDVAAFVSDVTVPDGTNYNPGDNFTKTWKLQNAGTCTWTTEYTVVFTSGNQMGGANGTKLTVAVPPGAIVEISIKMEAPRDVTGKVVGNWLLKNAKGDLFGLGGLVPFYVEINVVGGPTATPGGATATPGGATATATQTPNAAATSTQAWIQTETATHAP